MTNKQTFVPMEQNALNKEITSIAKTGNRLNVRIQHAALNAIFYSIQHGDIGFGQRLVLALNNGQRKNSLVAFLEKHGKFQWSKEQKSIVFKKRDDLTVDSIAEIKEHWFEAIKATEPKSMYDREEEITKLFKRWEREAAMPGIVVKHSELESILLNAYNDYHMALLVDDEIADNVEFGDEEQTELAELMHVAVSENNRKELRAA
jgi:hypothetical protein